MRHPWANTALLLLCLLQLATGFWGLTNGAPARYWVLWLHGVGGYTVLALVFWKGRVVADAIRRRPYWDAARAAFVGLAAITLAILATGIIWTKAGPGYLAGFSLMTIHAVLALILAALLTWHAAARRWIWRVAQSRDRRAFLRLAGMSALGLAAWGASRSAQALLHLPGLARRFTGSYEAGSLSGQFPVVSWLFDNPAPIATAGWQLHLGGVVERPLALTYEQVQALATDTMQATLDCTGGWYSSQEWRGVSLGRLLDMAGVSASAASVSVIAVSGYRRRFPIDAARGYLLATQAAGRPLEHGHGFPLRLVAPGERGFNWVKWVAGVEVEGTSYLWQPPLPLQ